MVAAVNSAGQGPNSDSIVTRTKEDIPTAPRGLRVAITDTSTITIKWSAPNPSHGIIIKYHTQYWLTGESAGTAMSMSHGNNITTFILSGLQPNDEYSFRLQAETSAGRGDWTMPVTAQAKEGKPSKPVNVIVNERQEAFIALGWRQPMYPHGIILEYIIKYQALEKLYEPFFQPNGDYMTSTITPTQAEATFEFEYSVVDLELSTKYEFRLSGLTTAGEGDEAVIEVYTLLCTDITQPEPPNLTKTGPSVIIQFDILPKYVSNVFVATESGTNRKKRQTDFNDVSTSTIVANLTRDNIDEDMSFTLGDNKTYGGYVNDILEAGATYIVRIAYASCIPIEECAVSEWSKSSIITAPDCSVERCGESRNSAATIGGSIAAVIIMIVIAIIVVVVIYRRRQTSPPRESSTPNEIYDEIDPQIGAKQSAPHGDPGYEVNLAMEVTKKTNQHEDDGLDYEDVNTKRESAYQGLDKKDMEPEHDYQGLGETEMKETDYQGLNTVDMEAEYEYQGLGKNKGDRKTSAPYVNVPI